MKRTFFYVWILGLMMGLNVHPWFDHDRAVVAGNKNEWPKASGLLQDLVTHNPENAEIL